MVWASRRANARGDRVAANECPVSLISGDSRAAVEEWLVRRRIGGGGWSLNDPARQVDAWLALENELESMEANGDGR